MNIDRSQFIAAVKAQSFDDNGDRIVHCMGSFTGADWGEDGVIATIESARAVSWSPHWSDHNLLVQAADGMSWRFQVAEPSEVDRR